MKDFSVQLIWTKIQIALTAWRVLYFWRLGGPITALVIYVVIDYVRALCAVADKALSSAVGFKGIFRKILIFLLVGAAHIVDAQVVGSGSALRTAVICFYLSNEGVSMLENAAHLGLPVPDKLKAVLKQLHDRERPSAEHPAQGDDTHD